MTIVRPADAAATAAAVREAVAAGSAISVRSGGHLEIAFPNPDGTTIDLGAQAKIEVADDLVTVGGGALWGDIALELGQHGRALTSGDTKTVGVGGLTLGGGIGWMVRQYGLTIDSLVSAEVVTASGDIVTANETENPDLFWALRGGGGNFGIVTNFTFRTQPLDGVVRGDYEFDAADLPAVLRGWRDVMRNAPEKLNATVQCLPAMGPDGAPSNSLIAVYEGADYEQAAEVMAPLRDIPGVTSATVESRAYADVLEEGPPHPEPGPDGTLPPAPVIVVRNGFVHEFTDAIIDKLVTMHIALGGAVLILRYVSGVISRVEPDATAFAHRDGEVFAVSASFLPPDSPAEAAAPLRTLWADFEPSTSGAYGNFSPAADNAITAKMYPPSTLERLRKIKRKWDPQNVFAHNHNVRP